jgi:hypothetical protein
MFGAKTLSPSPSDPSMEPTIVVIRQPNLLQSALEIGPERWKLHKYAFMGMICSNTQVDLEKES